MITSLWKSGLSTLESIPIISSMQTSQPAKPVPAQSLDLDRIVEEIMSSLTQALSERLGERIEASEFKQLSTELVKAKNLQGTLIETKEKYNDLVNRSTNLYHQARKISNSIGEFITSINLYLESEEMLVPLKEIQKGINELLPEKVEKQINYLIRIFQNNFAEVVGRKVKMAEAALQEELKLLRYLNSNLEGEIVAIRSHKNNDQSKYFEQTMKINALNDKISKLTADKSDLEKEFKGESTSVGEKVRIIEQQEKEIARLKLREGELLQKIKGLEAKGGRLERGLKEQQSENETLNQIIEKLKLKQEEIVEELQDEHKKKESAQDALRKKLYNEKSLLEEKNQSLMEKYASLLAQLTKKEEEIIKYQKQIQQMKENRYDEVEIEVKSQEKPVQSQAGETTQQPPKKQKVSVTELLAKLAAVQTQKQEIQNKLQGEMAVNVNKQVLSTLFLNYDDESKEWGVRRNIKHQIYALLDLKDRIPKVEQAKNSKWFGIF